ncbi:MAG: hypothetical protein US62_C0041G0010 [Candidatus Woesebacteria bacterium GW2011_GWA1_37_8]|uniref:DUF304 domain-containing protein n=1 Tax=Candidatus Woesebacteria bacterium GW2011_GWA1_37_8 TaxID=1618546 RepID=A0A0G0KTC5_9BACT|nr:MAG: hypothetical protein US62_C0041G0010 [Candidatus Woesebacteria bacterium GW2011_GWA1_37_8]
MLSYNWCEMSDVFVSKKSVEKKEDGKARVSFLNTPRPLAVKKTEEHKLPNHNHNPFTPFYYYPDNVNFITREPEEKIILMLRAHPITNLRWMLTGLLMSLAPIFFLFFPFFEKLPIGYQNILVIIWYLITFAFIFEEFLMWFFHVNIVTDERIIEVDFVSIFAREITDANLDQIQDVTSQIVGGVWTFFNFGNVIVQTASEIPRITFEKVPKPDEVSKILRELRVEEEQEKIEGRVR